MGKEDGALLDPISLGSTGAVGDKSMGTCNAMWYSRTWSACPLVPICRSDVQHLVDTLFRDPGPFKCNVALVQGQVPGEANKVNSLKVAGSLATLHAFFLAIARDIKLGLASNVKHWRSLILSSICTIEVVQRENDIFWLAMQSRLVAKMALETEVHTVVTKLQKKCCSCSTVCSSVVLSSQ